VTDKKQQGENLAAGVNFILGWRAADPEFSRERGYTGNIVVRERGVLALIGLIDREVTTVSTLALVPHLDARPPEDGCSAFVLRTWMP